MPAKRGKQSKSTPGQKKDVRLNRQIGAVVSTKFPKLGLSELKNHRISWIMGYTYVGDGTNGATDAVLLESNTSTYIAGTIGGNGTRGAWPIIAADSQLGASYAADVEKHYARKRINKMLLHVVSLQPSTANNMMCVVAPSRGPGLAEMGLCSPLATAVPQQTFTNVMSMDDAMTVDSFESKTLDITKYIAGGSGAKQNEFEIANNVATTTVLVSGTVPAQDLDGLAPACITVSGNSTTSALRGTKVHAIVIEQIVDFIDYVGGNTPAYYVGMDTTASSSSSSSTSSPSLTELDAFREELRRLRVLLDK